MTNTKKITKRESFTEIKGILEELGKERLVKVMEHELELLAKKNSSEKKPTAVQVANEGIKSVIVETLAENGEKMTISEMQKVNAELGELSNQRISALIRQLIADEKVVRVEEKRKAYFKIANNSLFFAVFCILTLFSFFIILHCSQNYIFLCIYRRYNN